MRSATRGPVLAVLLALAAAVGAAPPAPAPEPPYGFPAGPAVPVPTPGGVLVLSGDNLLVVQFDSNVLPSLSLHDEADVAFGNPVLGCEFQIGSPGPAVTPDGSHNICREFGLVVQLPPQTGPVENLVGVVGKSCIPSKVSQGVVCPVPVAVTALHAIGTRADESEQHESMEGAVDSTCSLSQRASDVPLFIDCGFKFLPHAARDNPGAASRPQPAPLERRPHGPVVADAVAGETWNVSERDRRLVRSHDVSFLAKGALWLGRPATFSASRPPAFIVADAPPIRLPVAPPAPAPDPGGVLKLSGDVLYVIDCKVDCVVRTHPAGIVKVTKKKGPRDISARFVDGDGTVEDRTYNGPFIFVLQAVGKGRIELDVIPLGAAFKAEADITSTIVDVGGPAPPPDPPVPPVPPDPPPKPPVPPGPKPDPAPISAPGLRVLIVYESADLAKYPPLQNAILASVPVRAYLNAKCVKGPDGRTPEYRVWDKDADGYADSKLWGDALERPRTVTPWIVISDGKTGYEGPLPADAEKTLTLLKKYGG